LSGHFSFFSMSWTNSTITTAAAAAATAGGVAHAGGSLSNLSGMQDSSLLTD